MYLRMYVSGFAWALRIYTFHAPGLTESDLKKFTRDLCFDAALEVQ